MPRAIFIDATQRSISDVTIGQKNEDIRRLIGGYLDGALRWNDGHILYVDEEGLLKAQRHFFRITLRGDDQPLGGNGVIVGPEEYNSKGNYVGIGAATLTLNYVAALVTWLTRSEAEAWARLHAHETASAITTFDHGQAVTQVLRTYGQLFDEMPKADAESTTEPT